MRLITKIEIHRFRSIADAEIETDSINIFSGTNNSGKSNVLRALNLFFNRGTSFGSTFNFVDDYNKAYTGWYGGKREIGVTLHFAGQGAAALKSGFSITRVFSSAPDSGMYEFWSSDPIVNEQIQKRDGNVLRQFNTFLGKIEYFYIPAVRDKSFVNNLFLNFEKILKTDQDSNFEEQLSNLSAILEGKSRDISKDFKKFIGIDTEAKLSSDITDILGSIDIMIDSGIEITERIANEGVKRRLKVDLFASGDGILMSYLAYFLAHICKKMPNKKFIWGFEEPENSLEYTKIQRLADDFRDAFSKDAQIFITTHSPAFINLKQAEGSTFYRVYIQQSDTKKLTQIAGIDSLRKRQQTLFDTAEFGEQYKQLTAEIGLIDQAVEIERHINELVNQQEQTRFERTQYEKKYAELLNQQPKYIFVCEDGSQETIDLWEYLLEQHGVSNVAVWSSGGSTTDLVESSLKQRQAIDTSYRPQVFRQIDMDGLTDEHVQALMEKYSTKYQNSFNYILAPLPVYEIENFAILSDESFTDEIWNENKETIKSHFEDTAEATLNYLTKRFYNTDKQELFSGSGGRRIPIIRKMWEPVQDDWRRYAPGKEITKGMQDYSPINHIRHLDHTALPAELLSYLDEVKKFFNH